MLASNHYFPPFSPEEYQRRYRVLREAMKEAGLDCLLVYGAISLAGNDTGQINAQYLSTLQDRAHLRCISARGASDLAHQCTAACTNAGISVRFRRAAAR